MLGVTIEEPRNNLLATPPGSVETTLPEDPAAAELADRGKSHFVEIVRRYPESSLCWALLAEGALFVAKADADINAYAYARTGYHRGLDSLRRAGWKGAGPIPWAHVPNRGFLRCLWALAVASQRIGDEAEAQRCAQFLMDSSREGYEELSSQLPLETE